MLKIDHGDWQFVDKVEVMAFDLDAVGGAQLDLRIHSEAPVSLYLVNAEFEDELLLGTGLNLRELVQVRGFDRLEIRSSVDNRFALRCIVTSGNAKEFNDGQPVVFHPVRSKRASIEAAAQRVLAQELARAGFAREDILDMLTGMNEREDDLDFEDDDLVMSEAEVEDLLSEAQRAARNRADAPEDAGDSDISEAASGADTDAPDED